MKIKKLDILLLIIPLAIVLILYPFLPTMVPRQFGLGGRISYMHKAYLFLVALLPVAIHRYYRWRRN
jgi:uncharacterized membrane protein